MRRALLVVALLVFVAAPAHATTFAFATSGIEIQQPVEQQTPGWLLPCPPTEPVCHNDQSLWVTNPTGAPWDVDDHWDRFASGTMPAFWTGSDALNYTADCDGSQCGPYRFLIVRASVNVAALSMSVSITPGQNGGTDNYTVGAPTWNQVTKQYDYYLCVKTPTYPYGDSRLQPIPNSNGGTGVPTSLSLSVSSSSSRSQRNTNIAWGLDPISSGVCPPN